MKRATINKFIRKKNKNPIICLTAYSKTIAKIADRYCDIILVGDSLGMVLYGMKTTKEVKIIQEEFYLSVLITSLIFWSFLGTTSGFFFKKLNSN